MKKNCFIAMIALFAITACQQAPKKAAVNIEAEKAVIDSLFVKFDSAFSAQDVSTLVSFLSADALCMGTDPSEFWNKQQMKEIWEQALADSAPKLSLIGERKIKVAADGNSAFVVDQYLMPGATPKIQWRNSYHLIKSDGNWRILVLNCAIIPKNEDIPKLNEALM
jgi:ketosteroid isomerase-like protein